MSLKKPFLYLIAVALLASCGRTVTVTQIDIIPEPVFQMQKEGSYTLNRNIAIAVSGLGQNSPTAKYIMNSLRHAHLRPSLVGRSEESDMELILNDTVNPELGDEGYLLEVRQTGIRLSANTETGLFYAYQSLAQMIPPDVLEHTYSSIILPECTVLDYPRFAWRGAHLEGGRQLFPVKFIKKYLDLMAYYKLNRFLWDIPGAIAEADSLAGEADTLEEDNIYSREEMEEVVAYAAALSIEVELGAPEGGNREWQAAQSLQEAATLATRGADHIVLTPDEYCRLDYYQADRRYQPEAADGLITLDKAYQFDPAPQGTNKYVEQSIVGGQCSLRTALITTATQAEYMTLPRLMAISECLWSRREAKNWNRFRKKVELQKVRLDYKGYNYCEGSFTPRFRATRVDDHTMNIAIETEVPSTYIFYTTDTSTPTRHSSVYLGPINLRRGTHIKIQPVYKDQEMDSVYEFVIR